MREIKIRMTGRAPVLIDENDWPVVARASVLDHDGETRSQANRERETRMYVRKHGDGRVLVHGKFACDSTIVHEADGEVYAGEIVLDGRVSESIRRVASCLKSFAERRRFFVDPKDLAADILEVEQECLADLAPEKI
jgi:hypothetical protein